MDARRAALLARVQPPDFSAEVDLEAHLALLPPGASAKGLFHADVVGKAAQLGMEEELFELAGVPRRRFGAFRDHSYEELLRLLLACAALRWPDQPAGEGLRRLGHGAYDALTATHIGRIIFGVVGRNFSRIAAMGVKGWSVSVGFGRVEYERLGDRRGAYFFEGMPGFIETYQVGVVEGGMRAAGVEGTVRCALRDLADGVVEFEWT